MLIVAFACFLALVLAWLLVPAPATRRTETHTPTATFVAAEATGD